VIYGGLFRYGLYYKFTKFTTESVLDRILKIGQYFAQLQLGIWCFFSMGHVYFRQHYAVHEITHVEMCCFKVIGNAVLTDFDCVTVAFFTPGTARSSEYIRPTTIFCDIGLPINHSKIVTDGRCATWFFSRPL